MARQDDAGGRRTARDTKDQAKFPGCEPLQRGCHHEEPSCNGFAPCRMVVGGHHDGAWLWCTGAAPMESIEDNEPQPEEGPTTTDQPQSGVECLTTSSVRSLQINIGGHLVARKLAVIRWAGQKQRVGRGVRCGTKPERSRTSTTWQWSGKACGPERSRISTAWSESGSGNATMRTRADAVQMLCRADPNMDRRLRESGGRLDERIS
ncbi:hypothetical protein B0H13DRAFT_1936411 [Mycena leptocephala]|nr:hypothetical protein B0H13DRAFT_1936411 [Mycena leptocephala]